jgi:hypothetical protein
MRTWVLIVFLFLVSFISMCTKGTDSTKLPSTSAPQTSLEERIKSNPWLASRIDSGESVYVLTFQKTSADASFVNSHTPYAWRKAAVACTLLYEASNPSCQDIINAGLWSFKPESGFDVNQCPGNYNCTSVLNETDLQDIGSEEWYLRTKRSILDIFYAEYYFNQFASSLASESSVLLPGELVEIESFWVNHNSNLPYQPGLSKGQYHMTKASWECPTGEFVLAGINADDVLLKVLNIWDVPQAAKISTSNT